MKNIQFFSQGRHGWFFSLVITWLAIGFTVVSFRYVQPAECYRLCGALEGMSCPAGACRFGEQKAGWPVPAFVDAPGGGSPTGGWGLLGPEDPPLPVPIILDVLFYSILLWFAVYIIQLVRRQALPLQLSIVTLPLNVFLSAALWFLLLFFGYYAPIGRGHSVSVYLDTPTSTIAVPGFSPIVSIPLQELIENYGDPDYVWLTPEGTKETPTIWMVLYWDSIGMLVELPQIANKMYVVDKTTDVEMILFSSEQQILGIAGKPLGEQKIPWQGYGKYQP
ncbi:MAG: hypothetical protein ABI904_01400 [Chloroflexota bacterium]